MRITSLDTTNDGLYLCSRTGSGLSNAHVNPCSQLRQGLDAVMTTVRWVHKHAIMVYSRLQMHSLLDRKA